MQKEAEGGLFLEKDWLEKWIEKDNIPRIIIRDIIAIQKILQRRALKV